MGEQSKIEWTDHTASPWYGCTKIAAGCANCYAADLSKRNPKTLGVWGDGGVRIKSKSFCEDLRRWNRRGEREQRQIKVFPSMCDPFEDRPELAPWRQEMFAVIDQCPWVIVQLLTKRPENIPAMIHWQTNGCSESSSAFSAWQRRPNVWLGCSIANQADADRNLPLLLKCRDLAPVLFLSAEPLLEPLDLDLDRYESPGFYEYRKNLIDWVICGGESGPHARPMHPDWARSLRDQCQSAGVPFFFKQWGEWAPDTEEYQGPKLRPESIRWARPDGSLAEIGKGQLHGGSSLIFRVGKKAAGRLLDGRDWSEFPAVTAAG